MSFGLKVWDASGVLTLDIIDRLPRYWGSYAFSFSTKSATVSVPGMSTDGTWAVAVVTSNTSGSVYPIIQAGQCYIEGYVFDTGVKSGNLYVYRI